MLYVNYLNKNTKIRQLSGWFCFNRVMEIVVKENIANKPMQNAPFVLGSVPAPDYLPSPELYSHYKATKSFNAINEDIYQTRKNSSPIDREKTPKSVVCILAAGLVYGIWKTVKHFVKK